MSPLLFIVDDKMSGYGYPEYPSALQAMGDNSSDPVTKALIGNITGTLPRKRVLDVRNRTPVLKPWALDKSTSYLPYL